MKRLVIATTNAGKLKEFRAMLPDYDVVGLALEVDEDGDTFAANALKKARAASIATTNVITIADDSGLQVDALGGAPGVHSARYAGVTGPDQDTANCRKLLAALEHVPAAQRSARFVCALALCSPTLGERVFEGTLKGSIAMHPRGAHGFGYDPLFQVGDRTLAEMSPQEKHALSHRGQALRQLVAWLQQLNT